MFAFVFVFVIGYPMRKRPFYAHPEPDNSRRSKLVDLLFRGLELVACGQPRHGNPDYVQPRPALRERKMDPSQLSRYWDAFKHELPAQGGFGPPVGPSDERA